MMPRNSRERPRCRDAPISLPTYPLLTSADVLKSFKPLDRYHRQIETTMSIDTLSTILAVHIRQVEELHKYVRRQDMARFYVDSNFQAPIGSQRKRRRVRRTSWCGVMTWHRYRHAGAVQLSPEITDLIRLPDPGGRHRGWQRGACQTGALEKATSCLRAYVAVRSLTAIVSHQKQKVEPCEAMQRDDPRISPTTNTC